MTTDLRQVRAPNFEPWICRCGQPNSYGLSRCSNCKRQSTRPLNERLVMTQTFRVRPSQPRQVKGPKLAIGVILLNVVVQASTFALVRSGRMESDRALELALWIGLGFYAFVLALVAGPLMALRPKWVAGERRTAGLLGAEVGVAAAGVLIAITWAVAGHPVLDSGVNAVVSEGTLPRVLLAFGLFVVAAPVVEECLFRGVVAESLRRRGTRIAILVSSVLFALAHLRSLAYYTTMGALFGVLYWRRGLKASIWAHAAFNGSLVALAVLVAHGPVQDLAANGVSVRAPSDWQLVDVDRLPAGAEFAIQGPSGASVVVVRVPSPGPGRLRLDRVAQAVNSGALNLTSQVRVEREARVVSLPAGDAVQMSVEIRGHKGEILVLPTAAAIWEIDVGTAGSERAIREYPKILRSLSLPASS